MLAYTIIPHAEGSADKNCPHLGLAADVGSHYAMPCALNVCHAHPLRRKGLRDLPLICQADWCLTADYRRCAYWQSCGGHSISLVGFILLQVRAAFAVCARSLQP